MATVVTAVTVVAGEVLEPALLWATLWVVQVAQVIRAVGEIAAGVMVGVGVHIVVEQEPHTVMVALGDDNCTLKYILDIYATLFFFIGLPLESI